MNDRPPNAYAAAAAAKARTEEMEQRQQALSRARDERSRRLHELEIAKLAEPVEPRQSSGHRNGEPGLAEPQVRALVERYMMAVAKIIAAEFAKHDRRLDEIEPVLRALCETAAMKKGSSDEAS